MKRSLTVLVGIFLVAIFLPATHASAQINIENVDVTSFGASAPLSVIARGLPQQTHSDAPYAAVPNKFFNTGGGGSGAGTTKGVRQLLGPMMPGTVLQSFEGVSDDDNAALLGFRIVPPDPVIDVGPNHVVQMVNLAMEIFDKNGTTLVGPVPNSALFAGTGGACESSDGYPIVLYDHLADRWLLSYFAVPNPFYMCIAISQTPDPTGAYWLFQVGFGTNFPDNPKLAVWEDTYYMTTRNFANGFLFTGVGAIALEKAPMLGGALGGVLAVAPIPGGAANDGWLPADLDGPAPPPGTPGIFAGAPTVSTGPNTIDMWAFDPDWAGGSPSFTQIATLPTAAFDTSINSVPQPAPGENLDSLAFTLMHRLQFRQFGGHQTLIANHTVDAGGDRAGVRWYEMRNSGGGWGVFQQGTYAPPDGDHRWMASAAMNGMGDIAIGYSVSGTTTNPSIRFTGQTNDQSGSNAMNVAETSIIEGTGVQQSSAGRWGDYSALVVDPSDDMTFWYTQEYYQTTGSFDFNTRIASFKLLTATEDEDGDGVADGDDLCPGTAAAAAVDDNGCSDAQVDSDNDGYCDPTALSNGISMCVGSDNCPDDANPTQDDFDMDGIGDACDTGCFDNLSVRSKAESGGAQVNLVWAPVPTATSYDILRSNDGPASGFAVIEAGHTTNFATYADKIPPPLSPQYWYKLVPNGTPACLTSDAVLVELSSRLPR